MDIMIAGTLLVDTVKIIPRYPPPLALVPIIRMHRSLGGLLPNVAIDLAKLDPELHIEAVSCVGNDSNGAFVREVLSQYPNIDTSGLVTVDTPTAFTDVMTVETTGERTFFTYVGANEQLTADDFDFSNKDISLLHIGYALLLPGLDQEDHQHGTQMARVLADAQALGIETSLDVVSEAGERFEQIVLPALKYTDYCTLNEFEAAQVTKVPLRTESGRLLPENMQEALCSLRRAGVRKWITIHCPEGAFGLDTDDQYVCVPSEQVNPASIRSTVGAGDAFAAGLLLGISKEIPYAKTLRIGHVVAAMSMRGMGASDEIMDYSSVEEYISTHPRI